MRDLMVTACMVAASVGLYDRCGSCLDKQYELGNLQANVIPDLEFELALADAAHEAAIDYRKACQVALTEYLAAHPEGIFSENDAGNLVVCQEYVDLVDASAAEQEAFSDWQVVAERLDAAEERERELIVEMLQCECQP